MAFIAIADNVPKSFNLRIRNISRIRIGESIIMENKSNHRLSILFLGTQMATGGAQRVLLDQARWFHEHGHKVSVIFLYDKEGLHEKWQAFTPVKIINLRAFHGYGKGALRNLVSLVKGLISLKAKYHTSQAQ